MLQEVEKHNSNLDAMFSAEYFYANFSYRKHERADVPVQAPSSSTREGLSSPLYVIDTSGSCEVSHTLSPEMEVLSPSYSVSNYYVDEGPPPELSDLGPSGGASPHGYSPITSSAFASRAPTPSPPSPTLINPAPAPFASLLTLDCHHATPTPVLNLNSLPIYAQGADEEKLGLEHENDSNYTYTNLRRDHKLILLAHVKASLHEYSSRPSTPIQDDEQSSDVEDSPHKKFVPISSSPFYNAHATSSSDDEDNDAKPPYGWLSPIRRETTPDLQPHSDVGYSSKETFQLSLQKTLESSPPRIAGHRYWSLGGAERKRKFSPVTEMEESMHRRARYE